MIEASIQGMIRNAVDAVGAGFLAGDRYKMRIAALRLINALDQADKIESEDES